MVRVYGARRCHKSRLYEDALKERGVPYILRYVELDEEAARELRLLFADHQLKYPTLLINGKLIRNPSIREFERLLAHEGLHDPGIIHEPKSNRFVRFMKPQDAFVSYSESDELIQLGHIEVPELYRGSGVGKKLALEVFPLVKRLNKKARITCSFMRKVASKDSEWAEFFNIK